LLYSVQKGLLIGETIDSRTAIGRIQSYTNMFRTTPCWIDVCTALKTTY
jgi:hypothetical protein